MLRIHSFDEIGGEFNTCDLDLPAHCRAAKQINAAFANKIEEPEDGWTITSTQLDNAGNLVIHLTDDRGHHAKLLVFAFEN